MEPNKLRSSKILTALYFTMLLCCILYGYMIVTLIIQIFKLAGMTIFLYILGFFFTGLLLLKVRKYLKSFAFDRAFRKFVDRIKYN